MEIERKFLFHKLPDQLNTYPHYGIEQAYVTTIRLSGYARKPLRRSICSLRLPIVLTVKSSGMLARQEFGFRLTKLLTGHSAPRQTAM